MDHFDDIDDIDDRDFRDRFEPDVEDEPFEPTWFSQPHRPHRLRHQVLVDGRLVDSWTEPVEGTDWEHLARDFDARSTCRHPPVPQRPPRHPFEEVLDWLAGLVGGARRLDLLDAAEPVSPGRPPIEDPWELEQYQAVRGLVDSVAAEFFGDDAQPVLRQALTHVWNDSPDLVLRPKSAPRTAGGICWAVARANGWFHPVTNARQKDVQRHLWLKTTISSTGSPVLRALRDLGPRPGPCPPGYPDLLALGHPDLLTASTRLRLVAWRDKATAARDGHVLSSPKAGTAPTSTERLA